MLLQGDYSIHFHSVVRQSDLATHVRAVYTFLKIFFSIVVSPRRLDIVPSVRQLDLIIYPF